MVIGSVLSVVLDCRDPRALSDFWMAVVGGRVDSGDVVGDDPDWIALIGVAGIAYLGFQRVPEDKVVKNRVHLDLDVADIEQAAERAEALGATRVGPVVDEPTNSFQVMNDPEGNEFCLVRRAR